MIGKKVNTDSLCFHCGAECRDLSLQLEEKIFCCNGCMTVFGILHQSGLDNYYCLNANPGNAIKSKLTGKWELLHTAELADNYILFKDETITKAVFYLPQIHCSSCIWLLEHLTQLNKDILFSEVNFNSKKIYITYKSQNMSLAEIATMLDSIGYEPYIEKKAKIKSNLNDYSRLKIGIAGFCFANIMILSFPEYLGLSQANDALLLNYFRGISLLLALPVFYISISVFFNKAWNGIKNNYLNIDFPVALAILVTFARSIFEIFSGTGQGYLDSMTGIVFFMLLGRYIQDKTNYSLNFNRNFDSYFPLNTHVLKGGNKVSIPVSAVNPNDILILNYGEIIPVDSLLSKGNIKIDYSYITGESEYQKVETGQLLYAGGRVVDSNVEIVAIKTFSKSNFIQLWNQPVFKNESADSIKWTDHISKYFTYMVLGIAISAFTYWYLQGNIRAGLDAFSATLIVACPCALLLSATFSHGFMMNILSRENIYFKNAGIFEKLSKINHVVFDKTGTLTYKIADRVSLEYSNWDSNEKKIAMSLLTLTNHPLAKSILDYEQFDHREKDIKYFKEIPGMGIEGWIDEHHFKIGNHEFTNQLKLSDKSTRVFFIKDKVCIAIYTIVYHLKPGILNLLKSIKNYSISVLSGDKSENKSFIEAQLDTEVALYFGKSPQEKLEFISNLQNQGEKVMMVGDGLNDAGALKQSNVGIALASDHFSFTPASDIIMDDAQIVIIKDLLIVGKRIRQLIVLCFAYSIIYNLIGIYFSIRAELLPVHAAILMPLSSLGVILLTYIGTKFIDFLYFGNKYKKMNEKR